MQHSESHYSLSDAAFETQFECGDLDATLFNHEAHIRMAWIHIRKYGLEKAIDNICTQLKKYVTKLGAEDKYNHTLTIAAIYAVQHFIYKSAKANFKDFLIENPGLKFNFKELIKTHYSTDIFNSVFAKNEYLEPELLPFT